MRTIKFRAWDVHNKKIIFPAHFSTNEHGGLNFSSMELMQYTGFKDKNGKEIYELMEINGTQRVVYKAPAYVLQDISTGDLLEIDNSNLKQYEITGEYSPI